MHVKMVLYFIILLMPMYFNYNIRSVEIQKKTYEIIICAFDNVKTHSTYFLSDITMLIHFSWLLATC